MDNPLISYSNNWPGNIRELENLLMIKLSALLPQLQQETEAETPKSPRTLDYRLKKFNL